MEYAHHHHPHACCPSKVMGLHAKHQADDCCQEKHDCCPGEGKGPHSEHHPKDCCEDKEQACCQEETEPHGGHGKHGADDCCHQDKGQAAHHAHGGKAHGAFMTAHHATMHCLIGCVIGEVLGLMIGVQLGLPVFATMALAVTLAYISGFSLSIFPLMKRTGLHFTAALKAIWLGEAISIGVMEIVMNGIDYHMGGMQASTIFGLQFWKALALAVPAGYIAALPVNAWLIGRQLKNCH